MERLSLSRPTFSRTWQDLAWPVGTFGKTGTMASTLLTRDTYLNHPRVYGLPTGSVCLGPPRFALATRARPNHAEEMLCTSPGSPDAAQQHARATAPPYQGTIVPPHFDSI